MPIVFMTFPADRLYCFDFRVEEHDSIYSLLKKIRLVQWTYHIGQLIYSFDGSGSVWYVCLKLKIVI